MTNLSPFLLVATLVAAVGVAGVSQAQAPAAAPAAKSRVHAAAPARSFVGPAVLVLAAR